ncbi:MAG: DoxX family membrane protein [Candidatus Omnitrophica bacterium]|nr:DoxX family membrane protein [Candidatus Omnitrophota bacterium]
MVINLFVIVRVIIGGVFVFSGFEKLISPYQNFLYVVQGYEMFPSWLENMAAHIMPWCEFFLGVFLLLGLWLRWVLRAVFIITFMFVLIVAQAIIRNLPIAECGCFGGLISIPLPAILSFDTIMLFVVNSLMGKEERTRILSLDLYLSN